MSKLVFRYGAMGASKTLNLLAVRHNYISTGKKVAVLQPVADTRHGVGIVRSRAGIECKADFLIHPGGYMEQNFFEGYDCVLVDECQFMDAQNVEDLRRASLALDLPILCFGIRTDFQTLLFPGSKRLLELADSIEEIKTICESCTKKAVFNMRYNLSTGIKTTIGDQLVLDDGSVGYKSVCGGCFYGYD